MYSCEWEMAQASVLIIGTYIGEQCNVLTWMGDHQGRPGCKPGSVRRCGFESVTNCLSK